MNDAMPNCIITLYFYEGDPAEAIAPWFSHYCANSSPGWLVQPNGSIHPPSRSRIVKINLSFLQSTVESMAWFAGFQMVRSGQRWPKQPDSKWMSREELGALGVTVLVPSPYPPADQTPPLESLTFDFSQAQGRLLYRFGVSGTRAAGPFFQWDDPRIYDDGSQ